MRIKTIGTCRLYQADYREVLPVLAEIAGVITDPLPGEEPFDLAPLLVYPRLVLWGAQHFADKLPAKGKWLTWDKLVSSVPGAGADLDLAWTNLPGAPRMHRQSWTGGRLHPDQRPVALMDWCLDEASAAPGEIWLDTHMGSASLGVACLRRGIHYVGIEINPGHYETAVDRLRHEAGLLR